MNTSNLTGAISAELDAAQKAGEKMVQHYIRAGELLVEVKASLPRGEWGKYLNENFALTDRTARRYMRLAENRTRVSGTKSLREALEVLTEHLVMDIDHAAMEEIARLKQLPEINKVASGVSASLFRLLDPDYKPGSVLEDLIKYKSHLSGQSLQSLDHALQVTIEFAEGYRARLGKVRK